MVNSQTLDPVIDICSGITLERSLATDAIGDVNNSIVVDIDDQINDILGVPILGLVDPFSVDLSAALADDAVQYDDATQATVTFDADAVFRINRTVDTRGYTGVSAGAGFTF